MKLAGRRILLIGIGFYDYEHSIVERLNDMGASVTAFTDIPVILRNGPLAGLLRRLRWIFGIIAHRHEETLLRKTEGTIFDQVLVIKGVDLSVRFLKALRAQQQSAELILYLWDDLARLTGIQDRLPLFDRVLSFDRCDVMANPRLQFRPLFYRESVAVGKPEGSPLDFDVSFVGALHSDRLQVIRDAVSSARENGLSVFVYLYTGALTWLKLALRGQAQGIYIRPLSYENLISINLRTRCVLDLPHPAQNGLTMRAIEALGLGKKLITTSRDIQFYDFYSPANIDVLNSNHFRIDADFVLRPAIPVPDQVRQRYTLDAWVKDVFGVKGGPV